MRTRAAAVDAMLIALTLTLVSAQSALLPRDLGRANYAATLAALGRLDPDLAETIHGRGGYKPLTCSGLLNAPGNRDGTPILAGQPYFVRVTGLSAAVSEGLRAALLEAPPATWELDRQLFHVQEIVCDEARDPWSGESGYEALAAACLRLEGSLPRRVTLEFASSTSFRSHGMNMPLPLPELVFGSLVERWNAFSPLALSPEARRFGAEMTAVSNLRLHSRPVEQKGDGLRIGSVGRVTYQFMSGDRYWLGVMHLLADFARFSGVGVQTATGMGQARRAPGREPGSDYP